MALKGKIALQRALREKSNRFARALTLEATKRVVLRTPVDTGRARNNWNVSVGSADESAIPAGEYGKTGSLSIENATAALGRISLGPPIFITNALPYIIPLEFGHSKQAPGGMIRLTIAELQPLADQIARRVRGAG